MTRLPAPFAHEFEQKGATFHGVAETLYTNPDRRYTQAELAEEFGVTRQTISNHLQEMEAAGWIQRRENQTTFVWDTDARDPGQTEWHVALRRLYADCWALLRKHSQTGPGVLGLFGLLFSLTAGVAFVVVVLVSIGSETSLLVARVSVLPLGIAFLVTGIVMTALAPIQALLNKLLWRVLPFSGGTEE